MGGNCTARDEKEVIVHFFRRGESWVYALLDEEQLDGYFKDR
jgi:hypothetical protein